MQTTEMPLGLAVALGIGLLVGIERERRKGEGAGRGSSGVRTFALVALLGGLTAAMDIDALVVAGAVFVGAATLMAYALGSDDHPGLTSETALLVTFVLGALAQSEPGLAAGAGVVVTVVLASRRQLHRLVRDAVSEQELNDLLLFAAAVLVVYPLVPDRSVGPYGGLNPRDVWRLVVLVMSVSGAGYLALRLLGPRFGLPLAGLAGGFISSAATIASMGSLSRKEPGLRPAAQSAAILSSIATVVQLVIIIGAASRSLFKETLAALAFAAVAALAFGIVSMWRVRRLGAPEEPLATRRAFDIRGALLFAASISVITLASAAAQEWLGPDAVPIVAAIAGFADAHAAAAGVSALVLNHKIEPSVGAIAVLAGLTTNTVTKIVAAFTTGGREFALPVLAGLSAIILAAWLGLLFSNLA